MSVNVKFTGDAADLLAKQKQVADGAAKITDEYKATSEEAARLRRILKQTLEESLTPLDKYNKKMQDLRSLLKDGKLSQEQFAVAADKAGKILKQSQESMSIPQAAILSVGKYVAALGVATMAANTLREAVIAARNEQIVSEQRLAAGAGSRGELLQIAANASDFQSMVSQADEFLRSGAAQDQTSANQMVFALRSAGYSDKDTADLFRDLGKTRIVNNPATTIAALGTLTQSMGAGETGTPRQMISKAFAAGETSPGTIEQILEATSRTGGTANLLGFTDEEMLAAIATSAAKIGSTDLASTRIQSLLRGIDKAGAGKGTLAETIDFIAKSGDPSKTLGGSSEAMDAFNFLNQGRQAFAENLARIQAANSGASVDAKLKIAAADPELSAAMAAQAGQGAVDVSTRDIGVNEANRKAIMDEMDAFNKEFRGWGGVRRGLWRMMEEGGTMLDTAGINPVVSDGRQAWLRQERERANATGNTEALKRLDKIADLLQQGMQSQGKRTPSIPKPEN